MANNTTTYTLRDGVNDTAKDIRNTAALITAGALGAETLGVGMLVPTLGVAIGSTFFLTAAAVGGLACVGAALVVDATKR